MTDDELLELWHSLPQDRQTQLAAILKYVAECGEELRENPERSQADEDKCVEL
jgi:hypothetical protein